jgi:hypothetical protein
MKTLNDYTKGDMHGVHYAVSIFFATAILWFLIHLMSEANPVWAISSMVATSDPQMKQAMLMLRARASPIRWLAAWSDWCSLLLAE